MIYKSLKLFLLLLLITESLSAQYIFDNITTKEGLSYKNIRCLLHDQDGYYWFGTPNGLNRFDGSSIKVFNKANKNVGGLLNDQINSIAENGDGKLWLATPLGVTVFDKWQLTFTAVSFGNLKKPVEIIKLIRDTQSKIWAFTSNEGIFWYDTKQNQFIHFREDNPIKNAKLFRFGITEDTLRKGIWLPTQKGLFFLDCHNQKLNHSTNNPNQWPILNDDVISATALDKEGNLWYSDVTDKHLHHYDFRTKQEKKLGMLVKNPYTEFSDGANKLFVDSQGMLWISTWRYRAFYLEKNTDEIKQFDYSISDPNAMGYGHFYDCYEDKNGTVWIGTLNGVSRWRVNHPLEKIIHVPSYKAFIDVEWAPINGVSVDAKNDYWLVKEDGLFHLKSDFSSPKRYAVSETDLFANELQAVLPLGNEVWCTSYYGLLSFDMDTKQFHPVKIPGISKGVYVTRVFQEKTSFPQQKPIIWVHAEDDAFFAYNKQTNTSTRYPIEGGSCRSILQSRQGEIFVAMTNGVWTFNRQQQQFVKIAAKCLEDLFPASITEDKDNKLWVGTNQGVFQIDKKGNCLYKFTTSEGLIMNSVSKVEFDQVGNLWIGTYGGLGYLNIATKTYALFPFNTRLPFHEYWGTFSQEARTGRFIIPAFDEVLIINTAKLQRKEALQAPIVTGIHVFEKEIPLTQKNGVHLKHEQNYFTINFSSPDHRDNGALQYAYKLEKYDANWIYCGRRLSASYTNVAGGDYRFLVKTIDNHGVKQEKVSAFTIYIKPPFWETWWFRLLVVGLFLATLGWFWKQFQNRQEQRKLIEEKERKLLEFNKVLAESKLTALRTQMNPHFVFNCLNSIQECIVFEKYKEAQGYLQKFSRLMRLVLQNSDKNLVPLHQEIEMLKLYLELEKLRFTEKFSYEIIYDEEELDTENIEIPPMLLQPFVENALWHGLLPKKENRVLKLVFKLLKGDILECSVDDNGIGRQKSYLLKEKQTSTKKHESKGIRITQDRLNLISLQYNQHARIEIIDKEDYEGNPIGTRVVIELAVG